MSLILDGSNGITAGSSNLSNTELGYLDGLTSNVQTQLTAKASLMSPTFSGTVKSNDTSVSVASGTYTATSDVLTVNLNVASHSVIVGDIIKVSGIANVQVATGGSKCSI